MARGAPRCLATATASLSYIGHPPIHAMDTAHANAMRNQYVPPMRHVPVWERMAPRLVISTKRVIGEACYTVPPPMLMPPPPPIAPPAAVAQESVVRPGKRRRIRWPKEPKTDEEEKAREIRKWQSIIELAGPEACGLAGDLMKEPDDQRQWRILEAVCHGKSPETLR